MTWSIPSTSLTAWYVLGSVARTAARWVGVSPHHCWQHDLCRGAWQRQLPGELYYLLLILTLWFCVTRIAARGVGVSQLRVSWKQTKKIFGSNRNKPKQDLCRFVLWNRKQTILVCLDVSNLYRNNWKKQNCFKTYRNNPKFSLIYQNMLFIKLFRLVFCLYQFNQNIKTVSKWTKTNQNKPEKP
jgi:hypothetical protein